MSSQIFTTDITPAERLSPCEMNQQLKSACVSAAPAMLTAACRRHKHADLGPQAAFQAGQACSGCRLTPPYLLHMLSSAMCFMHWSLNSSCRWPVCDNSTTQACSLHTKLQVHVHHTWQLLYGRANEKRRGRGHITSCPLQILWEIIVLTDWQQCLSQYMCLEHPIWALQVFGHKSM